jgi:hypothetical protein
LTLRRLATYTRGRLALALLATGFATVLLSYGLTTVLVPIYGTFDLRGWLLLSGGIFLSSVFFFFAGLLFAICLLRGHNWLKARVFERAIDANEFHPLEIVATCAALNVALFTIAYFLHLRDLLVLLFPPLRMIAELLPRSYGDLLSTNFGWSRPLFLLIPGAIGPAIVYSIRRSRHEGSARGETIFEVLQLLVYLSVILLAVVLTNPSSFSDAPRTLYWIEVGWILFPAGFGGVGFQLLVEVFRAIWKETGMQHIT